ncbi:PP-loop ATPase superfamily protein [Pseudovirgaria hyperparasitica]|uniref:Cytoplasmic tRNA 2-thiolation protein 1 n=1 Tax=Pseudovirgaria hyperparasitica TaxID=470096 RepID=A0A6A6VYW9_9PEZI|nr:PP-loop ATPase superfamily protein [Pseudovirgaria hyperparasitica]KAF2754880.1 PP-loop ATPase superfamily protein [Pseudovirgaria hyperparasitica]
MPASPCALCKTSRALIVRPKNHQKLCKPCFLHVFETEIHHTITTNALFHRGERIAIGASGGKDSTVLASVLKTLNERYDYGLELILLSIDEGITGYRDDSLETVKRNAVQYGMELKIVGYGELYGWTMDQVVSQVGKKGNCTYCGVFRRQALDRGAAMLGVRHVVTGHNADDMAETVLMNLLRGDLPRLARTTSIVTKTPNAAAKMDTKDGRTDDGIEIIPDVISHTDIIRSKPLKYAYEKEIVLYAHHKSLDYFSTECIYSPEAFRGSARALIKNLERIRPSAILDVVRSGEDMAKLVPAEFGGAQTEEEGEGGCGAAQGRTGGGSMGSLEAKLREDEGAKMREVEALETEITLPIRTKGKPKSKPKKGAPTQAKKYQKQVMGQCERCGYLSSQSVCKACTLLEGLNKARPKADIGIVVGLDT